MIEMRDVKFAWKRGQFSLAVDSFLVASGERVFLHGPSGSGKSTFLSLLSGVLVPEVGQIVLNTTDIVQLSSSQRDVFRAENMGIVFQQFNLIPYLSVLDNVKLGAFFGKKRLQESRSSSLTPEVLLERMGFSSQDVSLCANSLSVGQQQRVAVARALVGQPKLIIADEPTSALDDALKQTFISLLLEMCEEYQLTLVFVSHDQSLQTYFTRSVALKDIVSH